MKCMSCRVHLCVCLPDCVILCESAGVNSRHVCGVMWIHLFQRARRRRVTHTRQKKTKREGDRLSCYSAFRLSSTHNPVSWGGGHSWDWQSSEGWTICSLSTLAHHFSKILLCTFIFYTFTKKFKKMIMLFREQAAIVADLQQLYVVLKHNDAFTFVLSKLK